MIAEVVELAEFAPGQQVYAQGKTGSRSYIIKEGLLTCSRAAVGTAPASSTQLTPGMYFGERALIQDEARSASHNSKFHSRHRCSLGLTPRFGATLSRTLVMPCMHRQCTEAGRLLLEQQHPGSCPSCHSRSAHPKQVCCNDVHVLGKPGAASHVKYHRCTVGMSGSALHAASCLLCWQAFGTASTLHFACMCLGQRSGMQVCKFGGHHSRCCSTM